MELSLPDIGVANKIEDFEASAKSKELVFVSPVLWKDRYERRFLFTDYFILSINQIADTIQFSFLKILMFRIIFR